MQPMHAAAESAKTATAPTAATAASTAARARRRSPSSGSGSGGGGGGATLLPSVVAAASRAAEAPVRASKKAEAAAATSAAGPVAPGFQLVSSNHNGYLGKLTKMVQGRRTHIWGLTFSPKSDPMAARAASIHSDRIVINRCPPGRPLNWQYTPEYVQRYRAMSLEELQQDIKAKTSAQEVWDATLPFMLRDAASKKKAAEPARGTGVAKRAGTTLQAAYASASADGFVRVSRSKSGGYIGKVVLNVEDEDEGNEWLLSTRASASNGASSSGASTSSGGRRMLVLYSRSFPARDPMSAKAASIMADRLAISQAPDRELNWAYNLQYLQRYRGMSLDALKQEVKAKASAQDVWDATAPSVIKDLDGHPLREAAAHTQGGLVHAQGLRNVAPVAGGYKAVVKGKLNGKRVTISGAAFAPASDPMSAKAASIISDRICIKCFPKAALNWQYEEEYLERYRAMPLDELRTEIKARMHARAVWESAEHSVLARQGREASAAPIVN